jgi:translation initiation factor IF-2
MELLTHLRNARGGGEPAKGDPKKITLRRKTVSELKQSTPSPGRIKAARTRKVNVEYRRKRTYAMRGELAAAETEAAKTREAEAEAARAARRRPNSRGRSRPRRPEPSRRSATPPEAVEAPVSPRQSRPRQPGAEAEAPAARPRRPAAKPESTEEKPAGRQEGQAAQEARRA